MSINNFEEQTHELNEYELKKIVPKIVRGLQTKIGKQNAITNKKIIDRLKSIKIKTTPSRVRKMIHHIRITGLVERLIATSRGYYITNDKKEMEDYVESLIQRSESIMSIAKQLDYQRKKMA